MPNDLWVPSTEIVRPQNAWEASASFGFQFFVNCRMLQRDIIKDQIEQLGRVLAKVMGKFFGFKDAGNVQEGITVSKEELIAELDFDVEAVVKLTDEELRQFLVDRLYSAGQIDVFGDYFFEIAMSDLNDNPKRALPYFEKSLDFYQIAGRCTDVYSLERATKVTRINSMLAEYFSDQ